MRAAHRSERVVGTEILLTQLQLDTDRRGRERDEYQQKLASHLFCLSERPKRSSLLNDFRENRRLFSRSKARI